MVKHTKRDWRMAALVALIILVLGASTLTPGTTTWGDDHAAYINEGIAIAEGTFQEQIERNYAYHPSEMPDEAGDGKLVYVWGYPLLLSLVYRVVGFDRVNYTSVIWYKLISLLSLALTGGVLTLFFRRRFSLYVSAGAALVFCMSGNLFEALNTLYSDLQFLFFSMLTLWLVEVFVSQLGEEGGGGKGTVGIGMIYAISLWMTYETRLSGFTVCIVALLGHVVALLCKQLRLNRQNWWLHLILGVKFLSALARWRFHTDVRDFHCGIRGITREAASRCMWTCPGMEFATEMIAEAVNQGLRIGQVEVPLRCCQDRERIPKLRTVRDGWRHLRFIFSYPTRRGRG